MVNLLFVVKIQHLYVAGRCTHTNLTHPEGAGTTPEREVGFIHSELHGLEANMFAE